MELFGKWRWACFGPIGMLLCLWQTPRNYASHSCEHSMTIGPIRLFIFFYLRAPCQNCDLGPWWFCRKDANSNHVKLYIKLHLYFWFYAFPNLFTAPKIYLENSLSYFCFQAPRRKRKTSEFFSGTFCLSVSFWINFTKSVAYLKIFLIISYDPIL